MNFLQEAKEILEVIHSVKEKRTNRKNIIQPTVERWSIRESISNLEQSQKTQIKESNKGEKQFRITYLRTVIPYLDIKTILDLIAINREFNQFIISIYFYKFITDMHLNQKRKRALHSKYKKDQKQSSSTTRKDKSKNIPQSGFLSKITGAFSMITGTTDQTPRKEIDTKEFLDKLNIHEKILKEKQKQFGLSKEIRDIRDDINEYVDERYEMQMNKIPNNGNTNTNNTNTHNQVSNIMSDKEIEMIKKEKLEKESEILTKEVDKLKKESNILKKEFELLQKEDIDIDLLLNSLSSYVKNNMNYDNIKEDIAKKDSNSNINMDNTVNE